MIDKYDMLPEDESDPDQAPIRTRKSDAAIIGIIMPPLPTQARERKKEKEKQAAHKKT